MQHQGITPLRIQNILFQEAQRFLARLPLGRCRSCQSGDGSVTITNDGATILKAIGVDNPAAKVLVGTYE